MKKNRSSGISTKILACIVALLSAAAGHAESEREGHSRVAGEQFESGHAGLEAEVEERLETDRDSYTPAPTVVGRGRLMLESAYTHISLRDVEVGEREIALTDRQSYPELVARIGVFDWLELRLGWNYETGGVPEARPEHEMEEGESKFSYGFKAALSKQAKWRPSSALLVMVNTPTSGENDANSYILGFVAGWTLPNGWALNGAIRRVALEEEDGDHFVDWRPSVVLRVPLDPRWTAHAEYFAMLSDQREENLHAHYLSPGLSYLLTPDCELGTRFGVGLTDDSAAAFVNVGMAVRF